MKLFFIGRLTSMKVDARFLFNEILRSSHLMNEIFIDKKPVPPWMLFV